jgi:hypothetical protein
MQFIYPNESIITFQHNSQPHCCICPVLTHSVAVEIGFFHSETFIKSHFHFNIVESTTNRALLQRPRDMEVIRGKARTIG